MSIARRAQAGASTPGLRAWAAALVIVLPLALAAAAAGPAAAEDDPVTLQGDPAVQAQKRERLFAALAAASSQAEARIVALQIWELWFRAPDADAGRAMAEAMQRRIALDFAGAAAILDQLVASAPDWAEAWNQRATMRYLLKDFEGSLADIEQVLKIEPKHFGALSGQALILFRQGKAEAARSVLREALSINPFLSERALLGDPPEPEGQDI